MALQARSLGRTGAAGKTRANLFASPGGFRVGLKAASGPADSGRKPLCQHGLLAQTDDGTACAGRPRGRGWNKRRPVRRIVLYPKGLRRLAGST